MALNRVDLDIPESIATGLELMTCMTELAPQAEEDEILWTRVVKFTESIRAMIEVRNSKGDNVRVHLMEGEHGRWKILETVGPMSNLWGVVHFTRRPYEMSITSNCAPEYPVLRIRA